MDLSYKPNLSAAKISSVVREILDKNDRRPNALELDVSFSEVGNEGIVTLIQSLLNITESLPLGLSLASRMNRLTPDGVSKMLNSILGDESNGDADKGSFTGAQSSLVLRSMDFGWNNLGPDQTGSKELSSSLRRLVESENCPNVLRLYQCGLGPAVCRAIGKGLIKRSEVRDALPLTLHLCGNEAIGNAGTAALAAAIRSCKKGTVVFNELDLSSCNIGDAGAEALALALKGVRVLDLSNNKISNDGAASIGRALVESDCVSDCIDLSNNHDIGDGGATDLAAAVGHNTIRNLSLRSCQVHADGAKAFGESLIALSKLQGECPIILDVDLSGNPLGVLRGKKNKESGKYSASNLKSKASATTASYMNFIGKKIRSGLKEAGLEMGTNGASVDSDDDEDDMSTDSKSDTHPDASKARCGAKAFSSAIVVTEHEEINQDKDCKVKCNLAVRHCFLDRGGADALAATIVQSKQRYNVDLVIDASMNPVLEEDMIEALSGKNPDTLEEMAERHISVLETLRVAEERAVEASQLAASRHRKEEEWESDDGGLDLDRYAVDEEEYDSDARYDDEYDENNLTS
mmetsp:Transcript_7928/g.14422  ORF Transcript_7928/g.14422 Transcript_7928/m.14422 type:complete len:577 (+) Transcript_7928:82-1812(+)